MSKIQRKLQLDLETNKNLKAIDDGITNLESLELKLNNAPTMAMKEKYEIEMKKEIKKLQRVRDFFRTQINNDEIKDKSKAMEARKRVEKEMERFRAHEKEFKKKQFSKKALQNNHNNNFSSNQDSNSDNGGSGSDYNGSDDEDYDDEQSADEGEERPDLEGELDNEYGQEVEQEPEETKEQIEDKINIQKAKDKEFFVEVVEWIKKQIEALEGDQDNLRNKKQKGTSKKVKEKQGIISYKITQVKKLKDRVEEVMNSAVDVIDGNCTKNLKLLLAQFMGKEDDATKTSIDQEMAKIMEIAEQNRRMILNNVNSKE